VKERGEERSVVMVNSSSRWERGEERSVVVMVGLPAATPHGVVVVIKHIGFLLSYVGVVRMEGNDGKIG
jgi:hypothetical protein